MEPWNAFVEGDNLDVLPQLGKAGARYDVVYLDPPYNTGNPFAYSDKVSGRHVDRHEVWAAMMRPRLHAVRAVLSERGAVFVSIDDHEAARLRLLMDDAFGWALLQSNTVTNPSASGFVAVTSSTTSVASIGTPPRPPICRIVTEPPPRGPTPL